VVMRDGLSDEGGEIRHFADILAEARAMQSAGASEKNFFNFAETLAVTKAGPFQNSQ
jgi:hypothetical protein